VTDGIFEFKGDLRLPRLSPTRFQDLRECPLRAVWATSGAPRLLPSHPAAAVGASIHTLLEEAGGGRFAGEGHAAIEERWEQLVSKAESELAGSWLERHFVPLRRAVRDYEIRRIQAIERAVALSELAGTVRHPATAQHSERVSGNGLELDVATPDGLIVGRIDAVVPGPDGPVVRDYKSGAVFGPAETGAEVLREAYGIQLKLYAALFAATFEQWPSRLEIVPLQGEAVPVAFEPAECVALLDEARTAVARVQELIAAHGPDAVGRLASPAPEHCGWCQYRPACDPYRRAAAADGAEWPRDRWGLVAEIRQLGNGRFLVRLASEGGDIAIRGLSPDPQRHPALRSLEPGARAGAFNLVATGDPSAFREGDFTALYTYA
jgi:RecB family exonuclease